MIETGIINYKEIDPSWKNSHEVEAVRNDEPIEMRFQYKSIWYKMFFS
jgi:hypothetical protein